MEDFEPATDVRAQTLARRTLAASRRGVLCGALGASAAAVLAACSGGSESPDEDEAGDETPENTDEPVAALEDVEVGGGTVVAGMVIVRLDEESVVAFGASCPHKGTTVEPPENGVITCPNHGSQFDAENGELVEGPAEVGLTEMPVEVRDGQIYFAGG